MCFYFVTTVFSGCRSSKSIKNYRKDTGYSTGSSHNSSHQHKIKIKPKDGSDTKKHSRHKLRRNDDRKKIEEVFSEESESDLSIAAVEEMKKGKSKRRVYEKEPTISVSSDPSSE